MTADSVKRSDAASAADAAARRRPPTDQGRHRRRRADLRCSAFPIICCMPNRTSTAPLFADMAAVGGARHLRDRVRRTPAASLYAARPVVGSAGRRGRRAFGERARSWRAISAHSALVGAVSSFRSRCWRFARRQPVAEMDRQLRDPDPIYVMLGWGLNIVVGLAGLLDLGYVAFYAVGAYAYALLATQFRLVVLDLPAARRHSGGLLGHHPRLSGAAAARRLSGYRHARLRRNHPHRADQLDRIFQRLRRHRLDPADQFLRPAVERRARLSPHSSA